LVVVEFKTLRDQILYLDQSLQQVEVEEVDIQEVKQVEMVDRVVVATEILQTQEDLEILHHHHHHKEMMVEVVQTLAVAAEAAVVVPVPLAVMHLELLEVMVEQGHQSQ
jgi:aminopeptidase N